MMKALVFILGLFAAQYGLGQDTSEVILEGFKWGRHRVLAVKGDSVAILDSSENVVVPYYKLVGAYKDVFGWDDYDHSSDDHSTLYAGPKTVYRGVNKEGLMGAFMADGQQVFDFEYENIVSYPYYNYNDTTIMVFAILEGNQWRLRDSENRPFGEDIAYDAIGNYWQRSPELVAIFNGQAKFINVYDQQLKDTLAAASWDYLTLFSMTHNAYGLIRKNGTVIFPFEYESIENYTSVDSTLMIRKNSLIGMVRHTGEVLIPIEFVELKGVLYKGFYPTKFDCPPYLGKREELYEVLVYNKTLGKYETRSEPLFTEVDTDYIIKYNGFTTVVTDERGKTDVLVKEGRIVWRRVLDEPVVID